MAERLSAPGSPRTQHDAKGLPQAEIIDSMTLLAPSTETILRPRLIGSPAHRLTGSVFMMSGEFAQGGG